MNETDEDWFKSLYEEHSRFMESDKHSCHKWEKCKSFDWLGSAARSIKDTTTISSKPTSGPKVSVKEVLDFMERLLEDNKGL